MLKHENYKYIASVLMTFAFATLVYRVYKTKDVVNLSYLWIILIVFGQLFLLFYGIDNKKVEIIIPAFVVLLGALYILYLKITQREQEELIKELKDKDIL
jgi:uncharacterized protein with PQ loop repeat